MNIISNSTNKLVTDKFEIYLQKLMNFCYKN